MLTLSKALEVAEEYNEQQFISQPAQATICLATSLRSLIGEVLYDKAKKGEFDATPINQGEIPE